MSEQPEKNSPNQNPAVVSAQAKPQNHSRKKSLMMTGIIAILILVSVIVAAHFLLPTPREAAERASDSFVAALQKKDAATAYNQLSDTIRAKTSLKDVQTLSTQPGGYLQGKLKKVAAKTNKKEASQKTQIVKYDATGSQEKYQLIVTLAQEKGVWKVQSLNKNFH